MSKIPRPNPIDDLIFDNTCIYVAMTRSPIPTHAHSVPSKIKTTAVLEERFYEFTQTWTVHFERELGEERPHIGVILKDSLRKIIFVTKLVSPSTYRKLSNSEGVFQNCTNVRWNLKNSFLVCEFNQFVTMILIIFSIHFISLIFKLVEHR